MDKVRQKLLELIAVNGETLKSASLAIGRNHAYLNQFVKTGKPRHLSEIDRYKLARFLKVGEEQLRDESVNSQVTNSGFSYAYEISGAATKDLKVLGRAKAGQEGFFFDQGRVTELVDRPPHLVGVGDAFAVYATGSSMEPRYFEGELLHVHPHKPAAPNDFVIVECHDDSGWIKQLVKIADGLVHLRQLNPVETLTIPLADVRAIHKIVGSQSR